MITINSGAKTTLPELDRPPIRPRHQLSAVADPQSRWAAHESANLSVPEIKLDVMEPATDFVVVDVETSGFDPGSARVLSLAALTVTAAGKIQDSMYTLLDPGVDPGPTDIHGLTAPMLAGQPRYGEIAGHLAPLLRGRILVAHNAGFDYAFLAAEAHRCGVELPVTDVLCTLELANDLDLELDSLSLAALADRFGVVQARPHDALDDARVLAEVLPHLLVRAAQLALPLSVRAPATLPPVQLRPAA